jgi:hypothetical protein
MKAFLICIFCLLSVPYYAQIIEVKSPGNEHLDKKGSIPVFAFPELDHKAIMLEDELEGQDKSLPFRIAIPFSTSIDVLKEGFFFLDEKGYKNYIIELDVKGAKAVGLIFQKFHIPDGAELYVFNRSLTSVNGAITSVNNNPKNRMQVSPVKGDDIFVLYKEAPFLSSHAELLIETVTHVYRDLYKDDKNFGDSGSCNVNVVCEEGNGFEDEARAVVMIINGNGSRICSGALINNTAVDCTPYLLTAEHCLPSDLSDLGVWSFIFNYKSSVCDPTQNGLLSNSVFGSELIASSDVYDFALLELDQTPPETYNVYFAGWSRSIIAPSYSKCIHHPSGDVMKISTDDDPVSLTNYLGESGNNYWKVGSWDSGTTEGGSSGSPLLNPSGKIIGQLRGGLAACGNTASDYYGAFYKSWDGGSTPDERLMDWLDPLDIDVSTLNGSDLCSVSVKEIELDRSIELFPNPARDILNLRSIEPVYIKQINILDASGRIIRSQKVEQLLIDVETIEIHDVAPGIYQLQISTDKRVFARPFIKQ